MGASAKRDWQESRIWADSEESVSLEWGQVPEKTDGKAEVGLIQKNLSVLNQGKRQNGQTLRWNATY